MENLQVYYNNNVRPKLAKELYEGNVMKVPRIVKVVVSMCDSGAVLNNKVIDEAYKQMRAITGQNPIITKAKISSAAFKLREGMRLGCKVTLRKQKAYAFLDKVLMLALPSMREFRGLSKKSLDGNGNLNFGFPNQTMFTEIDYDSIDKLRGMGVTIVTSTGSDEEAIRLFQELNFPFKN